jgi:hypothetical protein
MIILHILNIYMYYNDVTCYIKLHNFDHSLDGK